MKKINLVLLAFIMLSLTNCSDNGTDNGTVYGTIQLSGPDTATLGTSLKVGNLDIDGLDTTGTLKSVTLLDENTTIEDGELVPTNFSNAFIIVAVQFDAEDNADAEKAISMTILKNGNDYSYVCSTPPGNSPDDTNCGTGYSVVDKTKKEVVFDNTTVINTDSGTILTLNGIVTWK